MPTLSAAGSAKILRLGVIHGGKIVEERLLRKRQPVVVGESTKNTIVLPPSAGVGASFRLFDVDTDGYQLAFTDAMEGRISVDDDVQDFASLRANGAAKKRNDHYVLALADKSRGKVVLGDVTLLFQFVTPPPEAPRTSLSPELRHTLLYGMDWNFAFYLGLVTLIYVSFALYVRTIPIPEEDTLAQIDDRFAKMIAPTMKDTPKEAEKPAEDKKGAEAPKQEKKKEEKAEERPQTEEAQQAHRKEIQQKIGNKGVLAILGTLGNGAKGGAVADVFSEGKAVSGDIDKAFQGIGGVDVARGDNATTRGGTGTGTATSIGGLQTAGGGKVGLGEKAEQRVGNVQASAPEVDSGALDPQAIARVVKGRLSAVKECYEHELKRNPKLSGKVVIRFTIEEDGRTTGVSVEDNSMGNADVGTCIVSRFERFRFPKPSGGQVTATFPFIFTPSS
jgi:TonB family protein